MKIFFLRVLVIFAFISLVFAGLSFTEVRSARIDATKYHFGSEAMIGEGGERYRSQQAYVEHFQFWGWFSLAVFILLSGASFLLIRHIQITKARQEE